MGEMQTHGRAHRNCLERQALAQLTIVHANDARWNANTVAALARQLVDADDLDVTDSTDVR